MTCMTVFLISNLNYKKPQDFITIETLWRWSFQPILWLSSTLNMIWGKVGEVMDYSKSNIAIKVETNLREGFLLCYRDKTGFLSVLSLWLQKWVYTSVLPAVFKMSLKYWVPCCIHELMLSPRTRAHSQVLLLLPGTGRDGESVVSVPNISQNPLHHDISYCTGAE